MYNAIILKNMYRRLTLGKKSDQMVLLN